MPLCLSVAILGSREQSRSRSTVSSFQHPVSRQPSWHMLFAIWMTFQCQQQQWNRRPASCVQSPTAETLTASTWLTVTRLPWTAGAA